MRQPQSLQTRCYLDHRRKAWVPALKWEVAVARGAVFFVTFNEGYEHRSCGKTDRLAYGSMHSPRRQPCPPVNGRQRMRPSLQVIVRVEGEARSNHAETPKDPQ